MELLDPSVYITRNKWKIGLYVFRIKLEERIHLPILILFFFAGSNPNSCMCQMVIALRWFIWHLWFLIQS
jgi:hypothetical protein